MSTIISKHNYTAIYHRSHDWIPTSATYQYMLHVNLIFLCQGIMGFMVNSLANILNEVMLLIYGNFYVRCKGIYSFWAEWHTSFPEYSNLFRGILHALTHGSGNVILTHEGILRLSRPIDYAKNPSAWLGCFCKYCIWMCAMTHIAYYWDQVLCSLLVPCVFGSNAYQARSCSF